MQMQVLVWGDGMPNQCLLQNLIPNKMLRKLLTTCPGTSVILSDEQENTVTDIIEEEWKMSSQTKRCKKSQVISNLSSEAMMFEKKNSLN